MKFVTLEGLEWQQVFNNDQRAILLEDDNTLHVGDMLELQHDAHRSTKKFIRVVTHMKSVSMSNVVSLRPLTRAEKDNLPKEKEANNV